MFDEKSTDIELDLALREGLQAVPTPELSGEFDNRVLSALRQQRPWWQAMLPGLKPMIAGAACSLVLALTLVRWAVNAPMTKTVHSRTAKAPTISGTAAASVDAHRSVTSATPNPEDLLDRSDLTASSLARLYMGRLPAPAAPRAAVEQPKRAPEVHPRRPDQSSLPIYNSSPIA